MKIRTSCLALVLAAACAGQTASVRVAGDPVSVARLAGSWQGEYWGASGGRRGTMSFSLRTGSDSLYGDVLMTDDMGNIVRAADPIEVHRLHVQVARQLRIDFVSASENTVRGMLEPYVAPDCDCTVVTTFIGQVNDDRMDGSFETMAAGRRLAQGYWKMKRSAIAMR